MSTSGNCRTPNHGATLLPPIKASTLRGQDQVHTALRLVLILAAALFAFCISSASFAATPPANDSDVIFSYAEATYPQYLSPAGAVSQTYGVYYYRYYPGTNAYIATANGRFYYLGPASNNQILDLGASSDWLSTSLRGFVLESRSQTIAAAQGGTITLPSGSSVTIPAGALATDQTVTLSLNSRLPQQPPSGMIKGVGPALALSFSTSQPFLGTTQTQGIQFVLKYGSNIPTRLTGSLPMTDIVDEDNFLGLVPIPCDSTSTCAVVPLGAARNLPTTRSINVSASNLPPAVERAPLPTPGAKSWNVIRDTAGNIIGGAWVDGVGPLDPNAKTLVLVHGILSSVEGAFNDPQKIKAIMDAGGYTQVVGFDYDWSKELTNTSGTGSGDLLANFLHSLKAAGLPRVDLEAHSLGGPVLLAASCVNGDMPIGNIVLLGSPVNGTPAANLSVLQGPGAAAINTIDPFHSVILNLVAQSPTSTDTDTLQQLFNGPFAVQVQPGSSTLANIRSCVANKMAMGTNLSATRLICVAATDYTKDPNMNKLGSLIFPIFNGEAFDGIVNQSSANCVGSGFDESKVDRLQFNIAHTQLENDDRVIAGVGQKVMAHVLPPVLPPPPPPPPPGVREIYRGTGQLLGTQILPTTPGCSWSSPNATATATLSNVELDITSGSLTVNGPFSGVVISGGGSGTVVLPSLTCTTAGITTTIPGSTTPFTIPSSSGPVSGSSDGHIITIPAGTTTLTGTVTVLASTVSVTMNVLPPPGLPAGFTFTFRISLTKQ